MAGTRSFDDDALEAAAAADKANEEDLRLAVGDCLGRYTIRARLGSGGMGEVFEGYDPELERSVALKVLKERYGGHSPEARARFQREAQAMARLNHPSVVVVYDVGTFADRVFVAMELVRGPTLAEWIARGPHSWRAVVDVFVAAGRGLEAAHAAGIVHRDFKPQNVILGDRVRVADFGLARAFGTIEPGSTEEPSPSRLEETLTQTGQMLGTPAYMAPEQRAGGAVTASADQYAFCVALAEALAGTRTPRFLEALISRGRSAEPARRFPSMTALLAELERDRGRTRRRALAVATAALCAVAALGITMIARRPTAARPVRAATLEQHQLTFRGDAESLGISPDGKTLAFKAGGGLWLADLERRQEREVLHSDENLTRWLPDSSAIECILPTGRAVQIGRSGEAPVDVPPGLRLYNRAGGEYAETFENLKSIQIKKGPETLRALAVAGDYSWLEPTDWSPDGKYILAKTQRQDRDTLWVVPADGRPQVRIVDEAVRVASARFVQHGRAIVFLRLRSGDEHDLVLVPMREGAPAGPPRTLIEGLQATELTLTADETRLFYTRALGPRQLWLVGTGGTDASAIAHQLQSDSAPKTGPSLSPDGKWAAYAAADGAWSNVFITSVAGGLPRRLDDESGDKMWPAWSPDGREVAFTLLGADGKRSIRIMTLADGRLRAIETPDMSSDDAFLFWAPGRWLAYHTEGHRNYALVDPVTLERRRLLKRENGWAFAPSWSPDGTVFAVMLNRAPRELQGLWLFDAEGEPLRRLASWSNRRPAGWTSDGAELLTVETHIFSAWETELRDGPTVFAIAKSGAEPRTYLTLPRDHRMSDCGAFVGGTKTVCTAGAESDVWTIDHFDRLLPH